MCLGSAVPCLDMALSALLEDLDQRGLLETTLVVNGLGFCGIAGQGLPGVGLSAGGRLDGTCKEERSRGAHFQNGLGFRGYRRAGAGDLVQPLC